MKLTSTQEMLDFGKDFAKKLMSEENFSTSPIVIELVGDVGAGKTTFTRGFAEALGVAEPVTSPSFTISKSYATASGKNLIHYDFYRLQDPGLMSEDLAENLNNSQNIVIVEWGQSIENILPSSRIKILIELQDDGSREVTL